MTTDSTKAITDELRELGNGAHVTIRHIAEKLGIHRREDVRRAMQKTGKIRRDLVTQRFFVTGF